MEEQIKRLLKRFEIIKHLADFSSEGHYHYFFNEEVAVYNYSDGTKEIKYKDVALDRVLISFPVDITASKLEQICNDLEKLIDKYLTPELREELKAFIAVKDQRKALDAKIAGMRKGNDET